MGLPDGSPVLLRPHPGRRREKPQLSCNSCRQRKRKCDRQRPCSHCIKRHLGPTCAYTDSPSPSSASRQLQPISPVAYDCSPSASGPGGLATPSSSASFPSPEATDLHLTRSGTGFKDSTHWTNVLSGVTETEHPAQVETASDDSSPPLDHTVLLFEGCKRATRQELLDALPPRRESDAFVAFYFRAQEYRSVIHPTEFLKRYNAFWEDPSAASTSWFGLLYSIFCLSIQVQSQESCHSRAQETIPCPSPPTAMPRILAYREKVVQCLIQAQFAKGGPDIMETLVHYIVIENNLTKDSSIRIWLLMGNIVQIAIRMGYHRDPKHFKSLSPYQGEMRRRMWAMVYSLDTGFATQMGLPSNIKHSLSDTAPPQNLQNSVFDATSTELPPARPIGELTSSTVIIAKFHIAVCMGIASDMVSSPHALSREDILAANGKLDTTYSKLPGPCQFRTMSESLLDPPSVVSQRINFYMHYQRARILINWKFLGTSKDPTDNDRSWSIIIEAALEILRLQHLMAEESGVLDASRPIGIPDSCFMINGYFLAASVACFLVQHHKDKLSCQDLTEIRSLLELSLDIWSRANDFSREASKVVTALRVVLRKPEEPGPQASEVPDTHGRSEIPFSSFTQFFDDLPFMMEDTENVVLPPLFDCWPQGDGIPPHVLQSRAPLQEPHFCRNFPEVPQPLQFTVLSPLPLQLEQLAIFWG
ncbi:Fungal-trans domain-containing protein [Fusarium sp. LHS14.1]|nr:Fungal-trans domain-containing protein [Fusarium sp. LHS14.1]